MFQDVTRRYDLTDATIEIVIMLVVAFALGFLLGRLWSRCCRARGVEEPARAVKAAALSADAAPAKPDDLKIIEGIGPGIERLLQAAGISTYTALAEARHARLKAILVEGGPNYQMHDPSSWPEQARRAAAGQWDQLKEYQGYLVGGRQPS